MKQKHLACAMILLMGLMMAIFATNGRVESMGKSDDFFMDDISIFTNPANVNLYANFLTGELGQVGAFENWRDMLNDPAGQWFGGAASYKIGDGSKVTLGLVFNRQDDLVVKLRNYGTKKYLVSFGTDSLVIGQFAYRDAVNPNKWTLTQSGKNDTLRNSDSISYLYNLNTTNQDTLAKYGNYPIFQYSNSLTKIGLIEYTKSIPTPVGNSEVFLGYSNGKDFHVGGHFYMASQSTGLKDNEAMRAESHVYKGDLGVNYGIGNHSLEASFGIADVGFNLNSPSNDIPEVMAAFANAESKTAIFVNLRFFYDLPQFGAKIVPVFGYSDGKVNVFSETNLKVGAGLNKEIEKGIFFAGITGNQRKSSDATITRDFNRNTDSAFTVDTTTNSARLNFGIERNIAWKWFLVRAGGQKVVAQQRMVKNYSKSGKAFVTEKWVTNPESDGNIEDLLGIGIGFNFDNKLKVDATINEQFPYQNPFGYLGDVGKRIATRVSATYSF